MDRVLASSEHDLELFERISPRCELARNAVDLTKYRTLKNRPKKGRFVCVGRVDVHKGIGNLLKALAELKKQGADPFTMHIIGPVVVDGLLASLEAQRAELGLDKDVIFEGRIEFERLFELMETAELAIFPSEYEAFGISVVEAMGAGVTSILNDIEPFRHFVQNDINGFLADFSSPASAAETLSRARALPKRKKAALGKLARQKALEYDWQATVDRFEALYMDVLEAKA